MANLSRFTKQLKAKFSSKLLLFGILLAFALAAAFTAVLTFLAVRDLAFSWSAARRSAADSPPLVLAPAASPPAENLNLDATLPLQPPGGPTPEPWDSSSRVNVLVMGLDYRDWKAEDKAPRTDTMMLLSLDTSTQTAGVLSIPRDLWVNLPGGFEPNKINVAHRFGELYQVPGGGPGLAMRTVETLLDIPIQFYLVIDFQSFVKFIDEIGGVKVNVTEPIKIDPIGKKLPRTLEPGIQVLPGDLALAYARARNTTGADFDRAERQQQVVFGLRNRLLSTDSLPTLIRKAPVLYTQLASGIRTNLSLIQIIQLAWLARQIPEENIKRGVIGPNQAAIEIAADGQEILRPLSEPIRRLRDEIFTASGPITPITPATATVDLPALVKTEAARVSVLNGTQNPGLASQTAEFLFSAGIDVKKVGNADDLYTYTTIIDYTGNPNTIKQLLELLGSSPDQVFHRYNPDSEVDILVLLGQDWAENNLLP